jgi:uncharacterized protein YcgL (UPF0745 family)
MLCYVYKSSKKEGVYLYVESKNALNELPEELKTLTGKLELALTFKLTEDRKIQKVKAVDVMTAIKEKGYFLRIDSKDEIERLENEETEMVKNYFSKSN